MIAGFSHKKKGNRFEQQLANSKPPRLLKPQMAKKINL
jgi:hypothetical protein